MIQDVIRAYASDHDLDIVGFYVVLDDIERGLSEALHAAESKKAGHIILSSAQTLELVPEILISVIDRLIEQKVYLSFASDDVRYDAKSLSVLKKLLNASKTAVYHARSHRIKSGLKNKRPATTRKFGIGEDEQCIIRQIFDLHEQGQSLQRICELLAMGDVKTVQNKKWHPTTIKRILDRAN